MNNPIPSPCHSPKCGAMIHRLPHERTGKTASIDATPSPEGNIQIVSTDMETWTYRVVGRADLPAVRADQGDLYTNHRMTCKDNGRFPR